MSDHEKINRQSAAMHLVIASRIRAGDRSPILRAHSNLERWRLSFGGELPAAYAEWVELLDSGIERVLLALEGDDQSSVRVRSSSPFTGILTPRERWDILRRAA